MRTKMTNRSGGRVPDNACIECGTLMNKTVGPMKLRVNGEEIVVPDIEQLKCPHCGAAMTNDAGAGQLFEGAMKCYRARYDLLSPDEIRAVREGDHLSQEALARLFRMKPHLIERWEASRLVQTPVQDALLR